MRGSNTPILFGARPGNLETVRHLVAGGADVNVTAAPGTSELVVASHSGNTALPRPRLSRRGSWAWRRTRPKDERLVLEPTKAAIDVRVDVNAADVAGNHDVEYRGPETPRHCRLVADGDRRGRKRSEGEGRDTACRNHRLHVGDNSTVEPLRCLDETRGSRLAT